MKAAFLLWPKPHSDQAQAQVLVLVLIGYVLVCLTAADS